MISDTHMLKYPWKLCSKISVRTCPRSACTSIGDQLKTLVNNAIVKPSIPSIIFTAFHLPISLSIRSVHQLPPMGAFIGRSLVCLNPISSSHCRMCMATGKGRPKCWAASIFNLSQRYHAVDGFNDPSSLQAGSSTSTTSIHPPGLRALWIMI